MLETVSLIAGIVFGGIVALTAYLTYHEHQKKKRIKKYEEKRALELKNQKLEQESRDIKMKSEMITALGTVLDEKLEGYETNEEAKAGRKEIWNAINKVDKELVQHFEESIKAELNRLSRDIVTFADGCRAGITKSAVAFLHISESFDRYKELGGNHYVDEQFEFIKECMKKFEATK